MNLFVSYHYDNANLWVPNIVLPFLGALGVEAKTGNFLPGQIIAQGVPLPIKSCDLVVGFVTKPWNEAPWVRDEINHAISAGIEVLPFVEQSLPQDLGGILSGRQSIPIDLAQKELVLLELAKFIAEKKSLFRRTRLLILPPAMLKKAQQHLKDKSLYCSYKFRDRSSESMEYETVPYKVACGLAVDISNIPSDDAYIQLALFSPRSSSTESFSWSCGYLPFNVLSVKLQNDLA